MAAWYSQEVLPRKDSKDPRPLPAFCDGNMFQGQLGWEGKLPFRGHHCHGMSMPGMVLYSSWLSAPGTGVLLLIDDKPFQVWTPE